jgi:hypothetical protein
MSIQNALNEKIFAIMWFAFVALFAISLIHFLYLMAIIFLPVLTNIFIQVIDQNQTVRCTLQKKVLFQSISGEVPAFHVWLISKGCHAGDRFLIYLLSKNLEKSTMTELINKFSAKLIPE